MLLALEAGAIDQNEEKPEVSSTSMSTEKFI